MGRMQAEEMKAQFGSLEQTLRWHLTYNHYPPVSVSMVPVCAEAIDHANVEDYDTLLNLPEGITFKGNTKAPVYEIINAHHLQTYLEDQDNG